MKIEKEGQGKREGKQDEKEYRKRIEKVYNKMKLRTDTGLLVKKTKTMIKLF